MTPRPPAAGDLNWERLQITATIAASLAAFPHLRFYQLLHNAMSEYKDFANKDWFYVSDEDVLRALNTYYYKHTEEKRT